MSLYDKMLCGRCNHPRHRHTGNHEEGHRTMCRQEIGRKLHCACKVFVEVQADSSVSKRQEASRG